MAKLWNRNFTRLTIGMVISAMGGIGLNVALSVIVFQETQSTALAAVFAALSMLPQFVLPLIVGPLVDRRNPLKVLITNELVLAAVFFITAAVTCFVGFNYTLYLVFSLVIGCMGVISHLSGESIVPQVMAKEHYSRGNAILGIIYPLCSIAVTPLAMFIYERFGMHVILLGYGVACLLDVAVESGIKVEFEYIQAQMTSLRDYFGDLKDAFSYFRNDTAIRSVFLLFACTMFATASENVLLYPYFNTHATLTNADYAILASIRSAGYMMGGFFHYLVKIPDRKRYHIATVVYFCFVLMDAPLFLMPYWAICATRFVLGLLGSNSANIRISAVQAHVPPHKRAKINALFSVLVSFAMMFGQLLAGALGEALPYWLIQLCFQSVFLVGILSFILPRRNKVKELYNYSSSA